MGNAWGDHRLLAVVPVAPSIPGGARIWTLTLMFPGLDESEDFVFKRVSCLNNWTRRKLRKIKSKSKIKDSALSIIDSHDAVVPSSDNPPGTGTWAGTRK